MNDGRDRRFERVKTARSRSVSSTRWLERQLNDPYVAQAQREGWRSRAAFKLIQLDERFHLLRPGAVVLDLGAAPGGWTQVAVRRVGADIGIGVDAGKDDRHRDAGADGAGDTANGSAPDESREYPGDGNASSANEGRRNHGRQDDFRQDNGRPRGSGPGGRGGGKRRGRVVGLDLLAVTPIAGALLLQGDINDPDCPQRLAVALGRSADVILSDMAAATTGHSGTDYLRTMGLAEAAYETGRPLLAPGGAFVCKLFQGGAERDFLTRLKLDFATVRHAKPAASRQESRETYLVAVGYRGASCPFTDDDSGV